MEPPKTRYAKSGDVHIAYQVIGTGTLDLVFVSGFVALSLEVLWTRMLAEGTGSRIYIFVIILAVYLVGIAASS